MSAHAHYSKSARYYDAIYEAAGKDYAREAERIHDLIQRHKRSPGHALLDVACGTCGHIGFLRQHYQVEGLDLDPDMLAIARLRQPDIPLHQGDMTAFDLGRRFDAIVSLFGAIAYMGTLPRLEQALRTMTRHLHPGGIVIVEPFLKPEDVRQGYIGADFVDQPEMKIARMSVSRVEGRVVILDFHFLVASPGGVEHFTERHDLAAFSYEEYAGAFRAAGLQVTYDPQGPIGRGLYTGVKPA